MKVTVPLFKYQQEFLQAQERYAHMEAGFGAGKSKVLGLTAALFSQIYGEYDAFLCATTRSQCELVLVKPFMAELAEVFGLHEDHDYVYNKSAGYFDFGYGGKVYVKGVFNYDVVFRGANLGWMVGDEVDFWNPKAWKAMKSRVRKGPELIRTGCTPLDFNHIWTDFYDAETGEYRTDNRRLIKATSYDNYLLSDDFLHDLKDSYSPQEFRREVMAERLSMGGERVFYEFNRELHYKRGEVPGFVKRCPKQFFITDYNVNPYCGVYVCKVAGHIHIWGEEMHRNTSSDQVAPLVLAKHPNITVGGDPYDQGRNSRTYVTHNTVWQNHGANVINLRRVKPGRRAVVGNSNLYHKRITIYGDHCPNLVRDLERAIRDENNPDQIDKSNGDIGHFCDVFGHVNTLLLPIKDKAELKPIIL